jgi:hypothetical protein
MKRHPSVPQQLVHARQPMGLDAAQGVDERIADGIAGRRRERNK